MQDLVGKSVEINIECPAGLDSLPAGAAFSRDISFGDHDWTVHCYPRGAPADAPAAAAPGKEFLAFRVVSRSHARASMVRFDATVLGRPDGASAAAAADVPPIVFCSVTHFLEYPRDGPSAWWFPWNPAWASGGRRPASARDLAEHCAVCGHITVVCGVTVLRHSPVPVPPSTYAADLRGLRVRNTAQFGAPDVSFVLDRDDRIGRPPSSSADADSGGEVSFRLNRDVLAARSPVFRAELGGAMAESRMPVIRPRHGFAASTFMALVIYIYWDRLPRDRECGEPCVGLFRDLLAAADWYALDRLKLLCARRLWEEYMSVETVSRTLWCADRYNCRKLRDACVEFITAPENSHRVVFTDEFLWLTQNSPSIIDEIRARVQARYSTTS